MARMPSLFLSLALSGLTAAAGAASPKASTSRVSGVVASVNAAAGTLTVHSKKSGTKEFSVPSSARITKAGKRVALGDLQPGDHVTVAYTGSDPDIQVKSVSARAPRTKAPSAGGK